MRKLLFTLTASIMLISISACSDHGHAHDESQSHDAPQHHDSIN
jgi:hypothetical protein